MKKRVWVVEEKMYKGYIPADEGFETYCTREAAREAMRNLKVQRSWNKFRVAKYTFERPDVGP